ncbi:caspase family protein [Janthinobacterium sp. FW305-129]|uniref:hypothetical protein n=1 Tax=Janthinobacterium sp. FW305-129 TaxID=2775054 RepID=UPI001E57241E|nr:hypothetical protein [Janthinobacterium sp. FW305-129]MCC7597731.1 caspase family protein [Janthinobacterium sp. FW305-129]
MPDHAILIGIGDYPGLGEDEQPARLLGPVNDVDAIKEWLLDPQGGAFADDSTIHVIISDAAAAVAGKPRPTGSELEAALARIADLAEANRLAGKSMQVGERLYLFMTGHGFSSRRNSACLFTADATPRMNAHIHATGWLNWLQDSALFREFVLWMDCCMDRMALEPVRDPLLNVINAGIPPRANFVAFAAQRPLKAVERLMPADGKVHGVFTWALLQGLRGAAADHNGRVTGRSLADWVRNAQSALMTEDQRASSEVALEPEILQEDRALVFARGIAPLRYRVAFEFPPEALGHAAWLWSGVPPVAQQFTVDGTEQLLAPGLYLLQVPALGLSQGFEVLCDMRVQVQETGPEVEMPAVEEIFRLKVDPGNLTTEIFVIDQRLSLVDSQPGSLAVSLPFGLFKIKMRSGRAISQRVIMLDRDSISIDAASVTLPPSAVVPLPGATSSLPAHTEARMRALEAASRQAVDAGNGVLLLMVRAYAGGNARLMHSEPWHGVSVVDADGTTVFDCARDAALQRDADPYAVGSRELVPGPYFLRQTLKDGTVLEQSLIIRKGWRLEVYLLRRGTPGTDKLSVRPRVSLMMHRVVTGAPLDYGSDQLAENARLALADERRILSDGLEDLLLQNADNPILGLIGAHLLLLEFERDRYRPMGKLDPVVQSLLPLLGSTHPDWVALALQCPDIRVPQDVALDGPPLFARSWPLLVRAAQGGRINLPSAMWSRVQALAPLPPFMAWAIDADIRNAVSATLRKALASPAPVVPAMAMAPPAQADPWQMKARQLQLPPSALELLVPAPLP